MFKRDATVKHNRELRLCLNFENEKNQLKTANKIQEIFQIVYCPDPHFREEGGTIYPIGYPLFEKFWPIDKFIIKSCERYQ